MWCYIRKGLNMNFIRNVNLKRFIILKWVLHIMCNGPTNALVCSKTLIHMSHIKTLKITPTCFDHQLIIIREFLILVKITG
jgi:hypothetical protein